MPTTTRYRPMSKSPTDLPGLAQATLARWIADCDRKALREAACDTLYALPALARRRALHDLAGDLPSWAASYQRESEAARKVETAVRDLPLPEGFTILIAERWTRSWVVATLSKAGTVLGLERWPGDYHSAEYAERHARQHNPDARVEVIAR